MKTKEQLTTEMLHQLQPPHEGPFFLTNDGICVKNPSLNNEITVVLKLALDKFNANEAVNLVQAMNIGYGLGWREGRSVTLGSVAHLLTQTFSGNVQD